MSKSKYRFTLDNVNEFSRGCRLSRARLVKVVEEVANHFKVSKEEAFNKIVKTRKMPLTPTNEMICPNCGKQTELRGRNDSLRRYCSPCDKAEYLRDD